MTTKYGWTVLAALLLGAPMVTLTGCDDGAKASKDSDEDDGGKKKKKKKKDADEDEKAGDGDEEKGDADEANKKADDDAAKEYAAADTPTCGPLNEVPTIPGTDSPPPTVEEWNNACKVNTQGPNSHPPDCEMKVLREWLRVSCKSSYTGYEKMQFFGAKGSDYFEMTGGGMVSFVMKLRAGRNQQVRMCKPGGRASLFVSWPSTKPKPLHIALARGDACEG